MSSTRVFARLGVTVGAILASLWVASPAFADDAVQTDITGLASTFTAGARGDTFRATMENNTDAEIQPIRRTLLVRLAGIAPSNVHIFTGLLPLPAQSAGPDEVRFAEILQVRLGPKNKNGDELRQEYSIQFTSDTPNGKGEVIFEAYRGNALLGSTTKSITIKNGVVQPKRHTVRHAQHPGRGDTSAGQHGRRHRAGVPAGPQQHGIRHFHRIQHPGNLLRPRRHPGGRRRSYPVAPVPAAPRAGRRSPGRRLPTGRGLRAGRELPTGCHQPPPDYRDPAPTLGYPKVAPAPPTPRSANAPHIQRRPPRSCPRCVTRPSRRPRLTHGQPTSATTTPTASASAATSPNARRPATKIGTTPPNLSS